MSGRYNFKFEEFLSPGVNRFRRVVCDYNNTTTTLAGIIIFKDQTTNFLKKEGLVQRKLHKAPHPNILPVLDQFRDDSDDGFVIYPLPNIDLFTYVKEVVVVPVEQCRRIFFQLVSAVKHLHDFRIICRDIKLGKIVFCDSLKSSVAIADLDGFELGPELGAKISDQKGSPAYIAPEILSHKPYDPYLADVWNLGVVLYVMLSGRYPFQDPKPSELYNLILNADIKFPQNLPAEALALLKRMLNRDVTQRSFIWEIFNDPWFSDFRENECQIPPLVLKHRQFVATTSSNTSTNTTSPTEEPDQYVYYDDPTDQAFAPKDLANTIPPAATNTRTNNSQSQTQQTQQQQQTQPPPQVIPTGNAFKSLSQKNSTTAQRSSPLRSGSNTISAFLNPNTMNNASSSPDHNERETNSARKKARLSSGDDFDDQQVPYPQEGPADVIIITN